MYREDASSLGLKSTAHARIRIQATSKADMLEWHGAITEAARTDAAATNAMLVHLIRKASKSPARGFSPAHRHSPPSEPDHKRSSSKQIKARKSSDLSLSAERMGVGVGSNSFGGAAGVASRTCSDLFSMTLAEACGRQGSMVPLLVLKCVAEVERRGLDVEGIYR